MLAFGTFNLVTMSARNLLLSPLTIEIDEVLPTRILVLSALITSICLVNSDDFLESLASEMNIPKEIQEISATKIREAMKK